MTQRPRPLTDDEAGVLAALLAVDFPGVQALREQARAALASPGCDCGCGTIDLHPVGGPSADVQEHVPVEGTVVGSDGEPEGVVLLLVRQGRLLSLEVAGFVDEPLAMPSPDRLTHVVPA